MKKDKNENEENFDDLEILVSNENEIDFEDSEYLENQIEYLTR